MRTNPHLSNFSTIFHPLDDSLTLKFSNLQNASKDPNFIFWYTYTLFATFWHTFTAADENISNLIESSHVVQVKLADLQANPDSPLYSAKSFDELGLYVFPLRLLSLKS